MGLMSHVYKVQETARFSLTIGSYTCTARDLKHQWRPHETVEGDLRINVQTKGKYSLRPVETTGDCGSLMITAETNGKYMCTR